jgi:hypothetical protein
VELRAARGDDLATIVSMEHDMKRQLGARSRSYSSWLSCRPSRRRSARYWNFQLGNIWVECLDERRRISVNHVTAAYEPDGSVRIVGAHRDPGHPNWIDTTDHEHGIMGMRWVRAETHPTASTQVVPLADAMLGR